MTQHEKSIVVAYDRNGVIGSHNRLPWEGQLPHDLERFRELTVGKSVIMGRSTWESLPEQYRPLPNRQNIVLSLTQKAFEGAQVATSLGDAFSLADEDIRVIGGAQVYRLALPHVDRIYATEIEAVSPQGDAFFPMTALEMRAHPDWEELLAETRVFFPDSDPTGRNKFIHSFVTYVRRQPTRR